MDLYEVSYKNATDDPVEFWHDRSQQIDWIEEPSKILSTDS